uniref:Uncharacterized protein n=1 Tax=Caenorhabditis japonica TaxID=281687 RepID=A0A8R1EEP0_CAEJA
MYYAIKYKQFQASSPIFHDGVRDEISERSEVSTGFSNVKKLKNNEEDSGNKKKLKEQEAALRALEGPPAEESANSENEAPRNLLATAEDDNLPILFN